MCLFPLLTGRPKFTSAEGHRGPESGGGYRGRGYHAAHPVPATPSTGWHNHRVARIKDRRENMHRRLTK